MAITYSQHSLLSGDDIHTIIWKKAGDTAARLALVVTEDKEGRVVLQEDNNSLWVLVDYTGPTYQEITAVGVAAVTSVFGATGDVTEADASFELADLVNVDLTGLQDDYIIKYDLGTDTWYAEADAGGGGGGTQSLDDVIRTAGGGTVDNNVIVPATDPIVLRDGAAAVSPLQVEKIEVGAGLQQPAIAITVPDGVSSGVQSQSADGVYDSTFYPKGFVCEPNPAALYSFGPRTRGGSNPGDGQDFWVGAGGGYGAGNQGGTLNLRGGPASGGGATEGIINLGVSATDTVNVSAAGKQTNIAGDLDVAGAVTGIDAADVGASATGHGHTLSDVSDSGTAAAEDVGTGPNQIVQLDGSSRLPAVDGSQLTGLTASGTIDVEEEGTPVVTDASTMNFIGSGVTATDAGGGQVNVTIAAGAAPIDTVFGRTGTVEAATSDYDASQIDNTPAGSIAATDVQAAINELDTEKAANAHTQTYSSIDGVPTDSILGRDTAGTGAAEALSAADVRTLLSVQENAVAAGAAGDDYATSHDADTTAHTASEIVNTPSGTLAATDVQAALTELDTEKSATGHGHTLSDISDSGTAAALDVGTAIGDVVQLIDDAGPKLPAIDGSNLTGLPSGVNQFKDLIDTPADYATHAGEVLRVNIGETAVEFAPIAGDMVKSGTTADNQLARWDGADSNSVQGSTVTVSDAGNITVPGTVDGRNVAADGTKLDLMTVTQAVDLDTMETDVAANTAAQVNIPTADEKAALAGTGTPAVGNPYVNDDDARLTDARTPVAHTHGLVDVTDSGTAAALDAGTAIGNVAEVVDVDGNPGLAALDGSQLTGVTAGEHLFAGSGVTTATTVAEINQWGIQDANIGVIEPNGIVQLDGTGILPALDGSQLTGIGTVDTSGTPEAADFARFTDADTIEGRSPAEVRADLALPFQAGDQATRTAIDPVANDGLIFFDTDGHTWWEATGGAWEDMWLQAPQVRMNAQNRIVGRIAAGSGDATNLTPAQVTAMLDLATTSLKGLLPVLPDDAALWLDGQGNFTAPPGGAVDTVSVNGGLVLSGTAADPIIEVSAQVGSGITVNALDIEANESEIDHDTLDNYTAEAHRRELFGTGGPDTDYPLPDAVNAPSGTSYQRTVAPFDSYLSDGTTWNPKGTPVDDVTLAVVSDEVAIKDLGVSTGKLADNAVTLAKMAGGTDGNLISFDTAGDPAYVATGTSGQILTSNGAGAAPTFQTAAGGGGGNANGIGNFYVTSIGTGNAAGTGICNAGTLTIASITALRFDGLTQTENLDVEDYLLSACGPGSRVVFRQADDPTKIAVFRVTGVSEKPLSTNDTLMTVTPEDDSITTFAGTTEYEVSIEQPYAVAPIIFPVRIASPSTTFGHWHSWDPAIGFTDPDWIHGSVTTDPEDGGVVYTDNGVLMLRDGAVTELLIRGTVTGATWAHQWALTKLAVATGGTSATYTRMTTESLAQPTWGAGAMRETKFYAGASDSDLRMPNPTFSAGDKLNVSVEHLSGAITAANFVVAIGVVYG